MKFRGHALAAFFILNVWSSQFFGSGLGLGSGSRPGQGRALAGFAKIEDLGKVKYGGLEVVRVPNGKPPPGIDRYGRGDAKNLVFD